MKWRNRWLTIVVAMILMAMTFVSNMQQAKAYVDTGDETFTYGFDLYSENGQVVIRAGTKITNPARVDRHVNRYGKDGNWYFHMNSYNDNPRVYGYTKFSGDSTFTDPGDGSTHYTYSRMSLDAFKNIASMETTVGDYKSIDSTGTSLEFSCDSYLTDKAYLWAAWFKNGDLDDIDYGNEGKAYNWYLYDYVTGYYKVNSGSYTSCGGTSKTFNLLNYASDDTFYFYGKSSLGYSSKGKSYTIPSFTLTLDKKSDNASLTTSSYTLKYNKAALTSVNIPSRTGYDFQGWYTSGGTKIFNANGTLVKDGSYFNSDSVYKNFGNLTLYAHWTPKVYTLTINPNSGSMYNGDNTTSSSFTTKAVYDRKTYLGNKKSDNTYFLDNKPSRTGYAFNGFSFNHGSGGLNSSGNNFYFSNTDGYGDSKKSYIYNGDYTGNVTATAQWTAYKLKLTYNANKGSFPAGASTTQDISYDSSVSLSYPQVTRSGYEFKGWTNSASWNSSTTKYTNKSGSKKGQDWAKAFGTSIDSSDKSVTLYAQWEKKITYTFKYFNNESTTADVIFHNADTSHTMTIPDDARGTNKTYGGHSDWTFRGFSSGTAYNSSIGIGKDTTQLTISNTGSNKTYYAQYQRTTTITYVDYGDDAKQTNTQQKTAYLNYNSGSVFSPTFKARTQNAMKYTENSVNGTKKESWSARGWTTKTAQNAAAEKQGGDSIQTYKDTIYYGLYQKNVTLTYNPNGGTVSPTYNSYTRYANASNVAKATKQEYTMPTPSWTENYVTKYSFGAWTYGGNDSNDKGYTPNSNFYGKIVGTNNNNGQFTYTPLVSDTVYAAWTNKTGQTAYEPNVTVTKEAVWNNPSGDNSAVDFDAKQNIDIDGIAKVTVKVNITNQNNIGAKDIKVTDYFNTDMWDYYQAGNIRANVSRGSMYRSGNTISWTIPDNTTGMVTLTYYVKIKESYWNVDKDTNDYINTISDLDKYLASLTDSSKNPGTASNNNFYYCSSTDASRAYVWVSYKMSAGTLINTSRKIHNATPYVVMRQVNWIPTIANQGIGIESDTNNIYHNIDSSYNNTYFVRYDTKGTNSTFRLYELSQLKRSYSYYQITDNIMDMKSVKNTQEVIDNALGISSMRNSSWSNTTNNKLSSGFKALDLLKVSKADNIRGSVTTAGVIYPYGSLTSYDTDYATNQDGLKFSVYPFVRTTNSKQNKTFETTRDTSKLANKRLDLTIDATDPIITADSNIKTKSDTYGNWTESDGYMDINLVNKATNPTAATKELTFKFKDDVSGVNSPYADNTDWIKTSRDNVQVTLKRVDNEPITIFDSNAT